MVYRQDKEPLCMPVWGQGFKSQSRLFDMAAHGVTSLPVGNTGAQMAGWLPKEIETVADLKGLKFHVAGLASMVLSKLGMVLQQLAAGDIYSALKKGRD